MAQRDLFQIALSVGSIALIASCGARSSLPDEIQGQGGGEPAPVKCTSGTFTLIKADPAVMFVLDRSGSMGGHLGKSVGQSRWEILSNALSSTLPSVNDTMEIGALLFPAGTTHGFDMSCDVAGVPDLLPALGDVAPLLALMQATPPGGATPTAAAIDSAAMAVLGVRAATTARAMVLATDGAPNCNTDLDSTTCRCASEGMGCVGHSDMCLDEARTVGAIADYQSKGLPTYVIGIQDPGDTSFSDVLNAMADAGGRPNKTGPQDYYVAGSESELDAALGAIRDQVGFCTYLTTSVPDAKGTITIRLGGTVVSYDVGGKEGWLWGNKANGEIVLVGTACAKATNAAPPTLIATVECAGS